MTIVNLMKKNKLLTAVAILYMALLIFMPNQGLTALKNSVYYLVEMFQVLPVIFLLTVVIESLIPKEMIIKHFGEKSGVKGNVLALVLGSISAGPIYAAFPISKMLLSKGASVSNIVIVLSSWAVIKVPMLANEAKFLGLPFMAVRWVLTVLAIWIMAWVTSKIVKKEDLVSSDATEAIPSLRINASVCIGCGICAKLSPELYRMDNEKAKVKPHVLSPRIKPIISETVKKCPVAAIEFN